MKVVITNLAGGLGNQMFQYAAGRALSLKFGYDLFICTETINAQKQHNGYELSTVFGLTPKIASNELIGQQLGTIFSSRRFRELYNRSNLAKIVGHRFITESSFENCNYNIKDLNGFYYMHGYWQSEDFFSEFKSTVASDFTFINPLSAENETHSSRIESCTSVSIHVRRGDYIKSKKALHLHGICPIEYYISAIAYIESQQPNSEYFVFTDDPVWVVENMDNLGIKLNIIHNEGNKSFVDMQLMSLCKHNIIANSSFSWWAAWLNHDPEKIVVAPKNWFASKTTPKNLIPKTWKVL